MEEFKGTKGKWHVGYDANVYDENGFDIVEMSRPMRINENWEETGVKHWREKEGVSFVNISDEEVEANAQLIASAPELLEVLINQTEYLKGLVLNAGYTIDAEDIIQNSEQIITKALGKKQQWKIK